MSLMGTFNLALSGFQTQQPAPLLITTVEGGADAIVINERPIALSKIDVFDAPGNQPINFELTNIAGRDKGYLSFTTDDYAKIENEILKIIKTPYDKKIYGFNYFIMLKINGNYIVLSNNDPRPDDTPRLVIKAGLNIINFYDASKYREIYNKIVSLSGNSIRTSSFINGSSGATSDNEMKLILIFIIIIIVIILAFKRRNTPEYYVADSEPPELELV